MSGKNTFKDTITSGTPFREIEWLEPLEGVLSHLQALSRAQLA